MTYPSDIEDVDVGEEFLHRGFIYLKTGEADAALVYDDFSKDWKKPEVEH